ncbi:hypothetical protein BDV37DRAFT_177063 [Aspergillus pseudonomiae]|uniref:Uncharacterized protein n=1 Tax=Aspergillus pseudonomiae TaxID=1506151 RepID=A0A5N7D5S2_9EURO|nr:uncharacterized protein BDV37DRAFT_177063 [Aspergillus pseudonomiae]KAE8401751.1 hypothetical protein BDV37DRAFT_177063 [Aspergillus pseudonomiae]
MERHSPASFLARSCRLVPVLRRAVQAVFSGQGSAPDVRTGQEPKPPPLASKTSSLLISPHIPPPDLSCLSFPSLSLLSPFFFLSPCVFITVSIFGNNRVLHW